MYRLLLVSGLLVLLYYLLRRAIRKMKEDGAVSLQEEQVAGNQMIQDPVCRVFIPRGNAVREEIGGQTYYFCSRSCADTFQKQLSS